MNETVKIACVTGSGTSAELMASAVFALDECARLHGLQLDDRHVSFGGVAFAWTAQTVPVATRATILDADAVLVAGAEEPALAEVMSELDLRAQVTRVRFGHRDDVAFVFPLADSSAEWAVDKAFEIAEQRSLRIAVVGDEDWSDLADAIALEHEHVHVEHVSPKVAIPLAAFNAGRFDVVLVDRPWAEAMTEIAAAPATSRVAAHGLLGEHGPSLFVPSPDGGASLADHGVVNPSSMLLAAAMMLEHGLGAVSAGWTLAGAVSAALVDGPHTPDLLRRGAGATTAEFTKRVVGGFQLAYANAEFWPGAA
ncbi:MAG TPA: isocitrate/isopropylmalate family dehydrogenase [Gaiellaceae bacterium]|nr:isocitrate/isopropylmalate family dehydrogenase [Gaiellaceae bacterium]